jgi:peptide-methionine (S)-S-oxide reductase
MPIATFGAGCFWGPEEAFAALDGVEDTRVGYMGGHVADPSYDDVSDGVTGHAEVVQVSYDPDVVDYDTLLQTFWACHDPTEFDGQGADVGPQYRSVIFVHDAVQEAAAAASLEAEELSGRHEAPVATEIEPAATFWVAEDVHQRFLDRR